MTGTAFDDGNVGVEQAHHFRCLRPHVLGPRVAREVDGDSAIQRLQSIRQTLVFGDIDDILRDVETRIRQFSNRRVVRKNQRPFELKHQGAARYEGNHVVALIDPRAEFFGDRLGALGDRRKVALFQLRHAAASGIDDFRLHAIACQYFCAATPISGLL